MKNQLLLLEDVYGLGRSGDIVSVKPGFARNFLLPQKKAIIAQKQLVKLQERLKEERAKRAVVDKQASEDLAKFLEGKTLSTSSKVDPEGHMYGSVSAADVSKMLKDQLDTDLDKRNIMISKPIKKVGLHLIELRLKEGVHSSVNLEITAEAGD